MVEVAVAGAHEGSRNMLERRIGGILKNIAKVYALDEKRPHASCKMDMIVVHSYGGRVQSLENQYNGAKVIGIDLVLLPVGVRDLMISVKEGEIIGVIAEHLRCANYLMCEIIKSGVAHVKFLSGTFEQMESMKVDRFIVAEEMVARVPEKIMKLNNLLVVPRMVSPHSSAQLIQEVLELAARKQNVVLKKTV